MATSTTQADPRSVNESSQIFAWWCGIFYIGLFGLVMVPMLNWVPPPQPTDAPETVLAHINASPLLVKAVIPIGYLLALCSAIWSLVVAIQLSRLEGRIPVWSGISLVSGLLNAVAFCVPFLLWSPMFYRPDRAPELIQLYNDTVWLAFIGWYAPFDMQLVAISVVGLMYKGPLKILPRWFCYLGLWVSALVLPGSIIQYFYEGPFAWDGLIGFWIPIVVFGIYYACAFPIFYKAIKSHKYDCLAAG